MLFAPQTRADVSAVKAQAELDQIISNWIRTYPDNYRGGGFGARIYPFQDQVVGEMRTGLAILLGAVIFVSALFRAEPVLSRDLSRASVLARPLVARVQFGDSSLANANPGPSRSRRSADGAA